VSGPRYIEAEGDKPKVERTLQLQRQAEVAALRKSALAEVVADFLGRFQSGPQKSALAEEGGVKESSSGVHGQQMSPLRGVLGTDPASTSPPAANALNQVLNDVTRLVAQIALCDEFIAAAANDETFGLEDIIAERERLYLLRGKALNARGGDAHE
jgi:hypothetical protein